MMINNELEIESWLLTHGIKAYAINADLRVDVRGTVDLIGAGLSFLPVQFGIVDGHFSCSVNQMTSLKGCPREVGKSFYCRKNKLITLKGGPRLVKDDFFCDDNMLTSLDFCPDTVLGHFDCSRNHIENLEFFPYHVGLSFSCENNPQLGHVQSMKNFEAINSVRLREMGVKKERDLLSNYVGDMAHINSVGENSLSQVKQLKKTRIFKL